MQPVAVRDAAAAVLAGGAPRRLPRAGRRRHRVFDLVGPQPMTYREFVDALARGRPRAAAPADFRVREIAGRGGGPPGARGRVQGMPPDELDCLLCDEVADPRPLEALLGRFLDAARRGARGRRARHAARLSR